MFIINTPCFWLVLCQLICNKYNCLFLLGLSNSEKINIYFCWVSVNKHIILQFFEEIYKFRAVPLALQEINCPHPFRKWICIFLQKIVILYVYWQVQWYLQILYVTTKILQTAENYIYNRKINPKLAPIRNWRHVLVEILTGWPNGQWTGSHSNRLVISIENDRKHYSAPRHCLHVMWIGLFDVMRKQHYMTALNPFLNGI